MKVNRTLCCLLTSLLLTVPVFGGCVSKQNPVSQDSAASVIFEDNNNTESTDDSDSAESSQADEKTESSTSSGNDTSSSENTITPAMWKAEDDNGNYIYMFGTIHATDESGRDFPDYFEEAFEDCEAVAVEADVTDLAGDTSQLYEMVYSLMYTDGTTIQDHLSKETYDALVKLFESKNMYPTMYNTFKPMMWLSLAENAVISDCGLDATKSVDSIITQRAKEENKEVIELESVDFQIQAFDSLSDGVVNVLFSSYTSEESYQNQVDSMKEMYDSWKSGTLSDIVTGDYETYDLTEKEKALYDEYNKIILVDRNAAMVEKAEGFLKEGKKVMICVGAAHFYGDDGIVSFLEKDGYTVTKLS